MIYHHVSQGSPEWLAARAGVITASNFNLARKAKSGANKGGLTDTAKNYAFRVAVERISGAPLDEGYSGWAAQRGHELEPTARRLHEAITGHLVETVGFIATDDSKFGVSADGLIGTDGGAEYKCFLAPDKLRPIILDGDITDVKDQCQGGMLITGRSWWELGLYCPALESVGRAMTIIRMERDDDYIDALVSDLLDLEREVTRYETALRLKVAA